MDTTINIDRYNNVIEQVAMDRTYTLASHEGEYIEILGYFSTLGNDLKTGEQNVHAALKHVITPYDLRKDIPHLWLRYVFNYDNIWSIINPGDVVHIKGIVYHYFDEKNVRKYSVIPETVISLNYKLRNQIPHPILCPQRFYLGNNYQS